MSEIKPIAWLVGNDSVGPHALRHTDPKGWKYSAGLMKISDHKAEVARLRAEVEVGEKNLAAAMDQLAESDSENAKLEAVANAARQVAAWFTSGNNVPVSGVHQMTVSNHSIMADVHVLNEALAAMGASA
jgi:hypothetical protein